jgi:hypothetical protein
MTITKQIFNELLKIRQHLDDIQKLLINQKPQPTQVNSNKLLELPDHLRRSFLITASKGECTATDVSNVSGKTRAAESCNLNQLTRMGWLQKKHVSKTVHFQVTPTLKATLPTGATP